MKKLILGVTPVLVCLSALIVCQAGAPMKIATVAPVADLVLEAEAKIAALEKSLATEQDYVQARMTTIPSQAGVLAVLVQAIIESEEKPAGWKASGPDLRDAAISVAGGKSYDDAKKGLAAIKEAQEGKAGSAKPEAEWNKLSKLGAIMKEVQTRTTKMRRQTRKITSAEEAARDASVLAVLALAAHEDTHEVKDPADVPEWQKYAKEFSVQMTAAGAAFKKNDADGAKAAFTKANTACNACHDKFRPNLGP